MRFSRTRLTDVLHQMAFGPARQHAPQRACGGLCRRARENVARLGLGRPVERVPSSSDLSAVATTARHSPILRLQRSEVAAPLRFLSARLQRQYLWPRSELPPAGCPLPVITALDCSAQGESPLQHGTSAAGAGRGGPPLFPSPHGAPTPASSSRPSGGTSAGPASTRVCRRALTTRQASLHGGPCAPPYKGWSTSLASIGPFPVRDRSATGPPVTRKDLHRLATTSMPPDDSGHPAPSFDFRAHSRKLVSQCTILINC